MIDRISVVMPTYNAMPYLKDAVDSILSQSFRNFEFVIVNDGSTDESTSYLNSLSDSRVRVINQENRGIETALNKGIEEAKYDWIARMDADDVALPERLEKEVRFLERHRQYAVVSCAFGYIGANGRRLKAIHCQHLQCPPSYDPLADPVILHQGVLYRREVVRTVGGYKNMCPAEDLDLWLRLGEAGYRIASMPDVLMHIRVLPVGISTNNFIKQRLAWKYAFACSNARRNSQEEPTREEFFRKNWPRGWKRLRIEGARQFRLAGAAWGSGNYFLAVLRFFLALLFRPDYVLSKFCIYFVKSRRI